MDMHVDPQDVSFMSSSSLDPCAGFMPSDVEDSRRDSPSCSEDRGHNCEGCQVGRVVGNLVFLNLFTISPAGSPSSFGGHGGSLSRLLLPECGRLLCVL